MLHPAPVVGVGDVHQAICGLDGGWRGVLAARVRGMCQTKVGNKTLNRVELGSSRRIKLAQRSAVRNEQTT